MEMIIQSMDKAREAIDHYLWKNPQPNLKSLYRKFRTRADITRIGDWPLISELVYRSARIARFYTPKEIVEAYKQSSDPYLQSRRTDSELVVFLTNKDELERLVRGGK